MTRVFEHAVAGSFLLLGMWLMALPSPANAQAPPAEMKVLEKRLGTWKTFTRVKAAEWTPEAADITGDEKIERTLGGRFIQGRVKTQPGNVEALWLGTYDPDKKEYRVWYFNSEGVTVDSTGKWDAKTNTMTWTSTPQPGITSIARWRFTGEDTFEWDLITKDRSGKVYLDMQGKLTRKK